MLAHLGAYNRSLATLARVRLARRAVYTAPVQPRKALASPPRATLNLNSLHVFMYVDVPFLGLAL